MDKGLAAADYAVVAGFFVVMLGIGAVFSGRMRDLKDYFGGGSHVPWWISGVSLYMTTFSAFMFVAYSAVAYQQGMVAITIWWLTSVCAVVSAVVFAARWRRAATTSPIEFVEERYGAGLRQGFAWSGMPLIVIDDALKLFVIGKMVTTSMGVDDPRAMPVAIAVCGTIMLLYTFLGGLWAVLITDFTQFVVMIAAILTLVPLVLSRVGGVSGFVRDLPAEMWAPASGDYTWGWIIPFFFVMIFSYATRWSIVQRYYAVPTDREARRVGYLMAGLTFLISPLIFLPALSARIFMPGIEDGNTVYVLVCKALLPVGMLGMVIAAMFSATMSMLSSDYNAVAAVMTRDIFNRLIAPKASDKTLVLAARLATLFVGFAAMGLALALTQIRELEDLVKYMAQVFSVLLPPVALPILFGLLTRRVSNAGGIAGFLAGTACGVTAYTLSLWEPCASLGKVNWLPWITSIPTLAAIGGFSVALPDGPERRERIARFLNGLRSAEVVARPTPEAMRDVAAAVAVIGIASAAMGTVLALAAPLTASITEGRLSIGVGGLMILAGLVVLPWATALKQKAELLSSEELSEDRG